MDIHAKQSLSQKQTLSHAQVQSLNVLAMTGDELERFLQRELEDNPLLEPPEYTDSSFSEPFPFRDTAHPPKLRNTETSRSPIVRPFATICSANSTSAPCRLPNGAACSF